MKIRNGVDWVCVDQSALASGLVTAPLYLADSPQSTAHFLKDCGARILILEDGADWADLAPHLDDDERLETVVCLETPTVADSRVHGVASWLPEDHGPVASADTDPDSLATIVYTSGTTGLPKGVMLSHRNLLFGSEAVLKRVLARPDDVFISFMPLAHVFERTIGYYLPMMAGCTVGYARSAQSLPEDLLEVRPTVFVSVPRVYEKVYDAVRRRAGRNPISHRLLEALIRLGCRQHEARRHNRDDLNVVESMALRLLRRLIARKIFERFGGRVRIAVAGGAAMPTTVARFFAGIDMPILEGYGLAEAAGPVCANAIEDNVIGSVGRPLAGIEVKIGHDGEILVRGPSVMVGYWKPKAGQPVAVDEEGWLHTGDIGELTDGRVYIRGRLKEIIVTSTGENIPPGPLEANIVLDPLVDQVMVVGEGRPYIAALAVLNASEWAVAARQLGLDQSAPASLCSERTMAVVLDRIAEKLRTFPAHCQVRRVHVTLDEWTVEDGLLTPTLKLRRHIIAKRFAEEIERLYRGKAGSR